ncbi:MAG: dipeptide epimerase [Thermoplasmata archaeon]|nr:dipeptide epimerase [Thermoplasmata archaeon]
MKIKEIRLQEIKIPLKRKFVIASGSSEYSNNVLIKIITDEFIGYGEASPSLHVLGENTGTIQSIMPVLFEKIKDFDSNDIRGISRILKKIPNNYSAKAGIDLALYDLLGKELGSPLNKILGTSKVFMDTDITIGIMDDDEALILANEYISQGFRSLKIKVGTDLKRDIERVKKIREAVGEKIELRIDANQGYNFHQARDFINSVKNLDIEFIEQPMPYFALENISELRKDSPIPIMLDESLKNIRDLYEIINKRAADLINIKLMKTSGITDAISIAELARSYDIGVMVGCMSETSLGISAGMHFALAIDADYIDLDSHFNLQFDIAINPVKNISGKNYIENKSGLGIDLKDEYK